MAPAETPAAQAKIILFAVALGERILAEQSDRIQAVPPNIHAETDRGGNIHHHAGIRPMGQRREARGACQVRYGVAARDIGIAQDSGIVRERASRPNLGRAVRGLAQPRQPVRRNQRVAVEQHRVPTPGGTQAGIGAGRKSAVGPMADQPDTADFREIVQGRRLRARSGEQSSTTITRAPAGTVVNTLSRQARVFSRLPCTGTTTSVLRRRRTIGAGVALIAGTATGAADRRCLQTGSIGLPSKSRPSSPQTRTCPEMRARASRGTWKARGRASNPRPALSISVSLPCTATGLAQMRTRSERGLAPGPLGARPSPVIPPRAPRPYLRRALSPIAGRDCRSGPFPGGERSPLPRISIPPEAEEKRNAAGVKRATRGRPRRPRAGLPDSTVPIEGPHRRRLRTIRAFRPRGRSPPRLRQRPASSRFSSAPLRAPQQRRPHPAITAGRRRVPSRLPGHRSGPRLPRAAVPPLAPAGRDRPSRG